MPDVRIFRMEVVIYNKKRCSARLSRPSSMRFRDP